MVSNSKKKKDSCWCGLRMFCLLLVSALGFAVFIQGIVMQARGYHLFYAFLTYVLAFLLVGSAKIMRLRVMSCKCDRSI